MSYPLSGDRPLPLSSGKDVIYRYMGRPIGYIFPVFG